MAQNILKPEQIAMCASKAGFSGKNLTIAVAIALAESRGNALAIGDNGMSFGLWQINAHAHPNLIPGWRHEASKAENIAACSKTAWYDPFLNARFAYKLSGGGGFRPWSVYMHGTYTSYMKDAAAGVELYTKSPQSVVIPTAIKPEAEKPYLRLGSVGPYVKVLQAALNRAGYTPVLEVDGEFGPLTLAAVKWFQAKMKIEVDGIVGPITWGKISTI